MDLDSRTTRLAALMEERLRIRGRGFEAKLARAGRRLPRRLKRDGQRLVEAKAMAADPRLACRIDQRKLHRSARAIERYLGTIHVGEERTTRRIHWLAGNVLNILIVFGLALGVMAMRGLI